MLFGFFHRLLDGSSRKQKICAHVDYLPKAALLPKCIKFPFALLPGEKVFALGKWKATDICHRQKTLKSFVFLFAKRAFYFFPPGNQHPTLLVPENTYNPWFCSHLPCTFELVTILIKLTLSMFSFILPHKHFMQYMRYLSLQLQAFMPHIKPHRSIIMLLGFFINPCLQVAKYFILLTKE